MRCIPLIFTIATFLLISSVAFSSAFSFFENNHIGSKYGRRPNSGGVEVPLPAAPATLKLDETLFNKLTAAVVPVINQLAANIDIPAISEKHFSIDSFHIQNFNLGPITFSFVSPNKVAVSLAQISFDVPSVGFELKDKILFVHVHCHGHAHASVNIAADFSFDLTDNGGKIALAGATAVHIDYKKLDVGYKMDHTVCKIVSKLINFIIGGISSKIKSAIEKNLGPAIQKSLTTALAKEFAKLPFTVTGSPSVANGVLNVPINLDSFIKQQQQQQALIAAPPSLSYSSSPNNNKIVHSGDLTRDLAVELPALSANIVLNEFFYFGKLKFNHTEHHLNTTVFRAIIPAAYDVCPGCPVNIGVDVKSPPKVSFTNNNFTLNIPNMSIDFKAFNTSTGAMDPLFTVATNVGFSVDQFSISTNSTDEVIKFELVVQNINLVVISSSVGKISGVSDINFIINLIISTVVPTFNKAFPGLPIPTGGAFSLQDIFIQIGAGTFQAGFNVKI